MIALSTNRMVLPALLGIALLGGCGKTSDNAAVANNAAQMDNATGNVEAIEDTDSVAVPANAGAQDVGALPTDEWVGRWTGPEGLFLDIQPSPDGKPGHYAIANMDNLDRQADYGGIADGATIRFVRDGKDLTIRPGTGAETGFKWLADKKDCLIVVKGQEGYCR